MLSKSAVSDFLSRKLKNHDYLKAYPEWKIRRMAREEAGIPFKLKTDPFKHQWVCLYLGLRYPSFLFYLDMGLGKTKVAVDLFKIRKRRGEVKRGIALVPNSVNILNWEEEVGVHSDLNVVPLLDSSADRWETLQNTDADFYVLNYAGLVALLSDRKGGKMQRNASRFKKFLKKGWDFITFDEIHMLKRRGTRTWNLCNSLCDHIEFRYGMTGTPMGRDPVDFWSEFYLIDRGETLGHALTLFKGVFYSKVWKEGYERKWPVEKFKKRYTRRLGSFIKNRSISYEDFECEDLPPFTSTTVKFLFDDPSWEAYSNLQKGFVSCRGNRFELEGRFTKMRMACSGFVTVKGDDTTEVVEIGHSPKLEWLEAFIDSIPTGKKFVVFHEFLHTAKMISDMLSKKGVKHVCLNSSVPDKKKQAGIKAFKTDPSVAGLVTHPLSGGVGLNLQVATYSITYELPLSPIARRQSLKRIRRTGKRGHTFFYDLMMVNSIEEQVALFLSEGKDLFKAITRGKVDRRVVYAHREARETERSNKGGRGSVLGGSPRGVRRPRAKRIERERIRRVSLLRK